ncbi:MAG: hypothetical protein QXU18_06235 [Thermoplasmatales archaeon]
MSPYSASRVIGNSPRRMENWVNTFLRKAFEVLMQPERSGRPARLSGIMDKIARDLRKKPIDLGYS